MSEFDRLMVLCRRKGLGEGALLVMTSGAFLTFCLMEYGIRAR